MAHGILLIFNLLASHHPLSVMVEALYISESRGRLQTWPTANPLIQGFQGELQ